LKGRKKSQSSEHALTDTDSSKLKVGGSLGRKKVKLKWAGGVRWGGGGGGVWLEGFSGGGVAGPREVWGGGKVKRRLRREHYNSGI